ncbi:hypothetical protein FHG87_020087 [Trinorchestia longiramus]|nr:hypothetical protein FHG87_020087 [Trinorchestia longiramus]
MNTSMKSLKFSRARFNSNSSQQQHFQRLVSTNGNVPCYFLESSGDNHTVFTTYLCEQLFSGMLDIKTKKRNRLCCKIDVRVAFAKVKPRISELVSDRQ